MAALFDVRLRQAALGSRYDHAAIRAAERLRQIRWSSDLYWGLTFTPRRENPARREQQKFKTDLDKRGFRPGAAGFLPKVGRPASLIFMP